MTSTDPCSLMHRRERLLETSVLLRCRWCRVCPAVRGVGSGVWSSRQEDVSPFAEVKDDGCGRSVGVRVRR